MDIIDRINHIIETEGLTVGRLARMINVKDQTLRNSLIQRKNNPGLDVVTAIYSNFKWLNPDWLFKGEGEMRRPEFDYPENSRVALASERNNNYLTDSENSLLLEEFSKLSSAVAELTRSNRSLADSNQKLIDKLLGQEK